MESAREPLIRIRSVSRRYVRGVDEVHALENVSLAIPAGRFVAFMGPSGSGKSTLMNLVSGIDQPSDGEVLVAGQSLGELDEDELAEWRARHVGLIFQFFNLIPVLDARDNVALPLLLTDLTKAERMRRAETALRVVGLEERVENDTLTIAVNWDEYLFSALTHLGLPSNKGRFDWVLEGAGGGADKDLTIRFDYNILSTSVGFQTDNAWRFRLNVSGINATVTLENGAIRTFRVGTPYALVVPANADVNHDGKVDASISFALDADFENVWDHHSNSGYIYTGGFGRIRVLDDRGIPTAERKVGPAFQQQCGPKVGGNPMAALKCYTSDKSYTVAFEPHGFTVPEIAGSLDLTLH